ncbi:hypothetical protein DYB36_006533, partial [Aphanomyces astaci]
PRPFLAPPPPRPLLVPPPPRPTVQVPPSTVIVEIPADKELTALINYVARCVYSLQMGDTDTTWRTMGFQMVPNGSMWIPPPNPDGDAPPPSTNHPPTPTSSYQRSPTNNPNIIMTGQQLAAAKDREKGHRAKFELSGREYDTLCSYLEDVTIDRQSICDVMAFALDHSECAVDISSTIVRSFHVGDSRESKRVHRHVPAMAYVARLFVVSDILHNSSAPLKNASLYRTQFEETLPDIMDTLNAVGHAIVGRMSYNAMRDKVLSVLHAWGQWSLFPPPYLIGLNATFLQKSREVEEDMDVVCAAMDADTLALNDERLKRKCRHAGLVAAGSKHDMYRRLYMLKKFTSVGDGRRQDEIDDEDGNVDGEPMEEDEDDIDGVPLDDDIDGVPLDGDDDVDGEPMDMADD